MRSSLFLLHTTRTTRLLNRAVFTFRKPVSAGWSDVMGFVRAQPGPVYSENMVILMAAGKEIPAEPAIITALARRGQWDESGFIRRIQEGQFSAIILTSSLDNSERFTTGVAGAIDNRYALNRQAGDFRIYQPRQ
jgi:hypothetical protein